MNESDPSCDDRQPTHEIKFLVRIRGARTPPPKIEAPVMKIPLKQVWLQLSMVPFGPTKIGTYHPAPTTLRPIQSPIPKSAHA